MKNSKINSYEDFKKKLLDEKIKNIKTYNRLNKLTGFGLVATSACFGIPAISEEFITAMDNANIPFIAPIFGATALLSLFSGGYILGVTHSEESRSIEECKNDFAEMEKRVEEKIELENAIKNGEFEFQKIRVIK